MGESGIYGELRDLTVLTSRSVADVEKNNSSLEVGSSSTSNSDSSSPNMTFEREIEEICRRYPDLLSYRSMSLAASCARKGELVQALAHFAVGFTSDPSIIQRFDTLFLTVLGKFTSDLKAEGKYNDVLECCRHIGEIFPDHPDILHGIGSLLYRMDFVESAAVYYQEAYSVNQLHSHSLYCLENIKNSVIERWHFSMLNDKNRNLAFRKSIERAVKSGYNRVLDIGAGTGILSLMAVDSGAEKVYACEKNQCMCDTLNKVIEDNGKSDSVYVLEEPSTSLTIPGDIPERVNLVVTETFDSCLFGEHVLKTLEHAWEELLCNKHAVPENLGEVPSHARSDSKHMLVNAKVIPQSAILWAVPIECDRIRASARLNAFSPTSMAASISEPYTSERLSALPGGYKFLSTPRAVLHVDFNDLQEIKRLLMGETINLTYECSEGIIDAFVMWFDLNLDDLVTITSAPDQDGCWEQAVFYVLPEHLRGSSRTLQMGDVVCTTFYCEGHMSLLEVRTPRTDQPASHCVPCKPEIIYQLNSLLSSVVYSKLWEKEIIRKTGPFIDLFPYPLLGLRALNEIAKSGRIPKLIVFDLEAQNEVEEMMEVTEIPKGAITFLPCEDYGKCPFKAEVLFHYPVDMCGLLKKGIFDTIISLRRNCLTGSAIVVPGKIEIYCTLIDSPTLLKQTRLVTDDNTVGYRIASAINIYQGALHFDIDLSTLPFSQLCNNIKLCEINFNCLTESDLRNMHGSLEVAITKNGKIMAIPFWFMITYCEDTIVSTADSDTLYHVAASIPSKEIEVSQGDHVVLHWTCRNSCVHVLVNKIE